MSGTVEFEDGKVVVREVTKISLSPGDALAVRLPDSYNRKQMSDATKVLKEVFRDVKVLTYQGDLEFRAVSSEEAGRVEALAAEEERLRHVAVVTKPFNYLPGYFGGDYKVAYNNRVEMVNLSAADLLTAGRLSPMEILRNKIAYVWGVKPDSFKMEFSDGDPSHLP